MGGGQYQDSQFTALIKEEPEDYSNGGAGGGGGGGGGGAGGGAGGVPNAAGGPSTGITSEATKSTDASCHSPDAAKPDTNTSSLLSALADVRELYYEHS